VSTRTSRHSVSVLVCLMVIAIVAPALAGRPLVTEDTGTLDPGQVEAELGFEYVRDREVRTFGAPAGLALNIGLLPRLEGTIGTTIVVLDAPGASSQAGIGDSDAKLKYRFVDETPNIPAVMGAMALRLPTGDESRGLGEPGVDVQALAVASKTFGPATLTVNAGYTFVTADRTADVVNVNASVDAAITDTWSVVAEIVSELATHRRADDRVVVRVGTTYEVAKSVTLDAAAAVGVTRASPDLLLTVGVTVLLSGR